MAFSGGADEIATLLGASFREFAPPGGIEVCGITTDSREVAPGAAFVARKGEKTDGHLYVREALERGASICIVEESWLCSARAQETIDGLERSQFALLGVGDPSRALGELARAWRRKLGVPTITVSGSNGKTTTKEMLRVILTEVGGPGTASKRSLNNHIGLPQTILEAGVGDRWLLLEAGMNHPGELDYLGGIAEPDVALILNVGPEHIEFFSDLDGVADAECEILAHVRNGGDAVLNGTDPVLLAAVERLPERIRARFSPRFFGDREEFEASFHELSLRGMQGSVFSLILAGERKEVTLPLLGRHNVVNAVAAALTAHAVFPHVSVSAIASAMSKVQGAPMRLEAYTLPRFFLLNDAYNANPASMLAALETAAALAQGNGVTAIFGDMLELGERSAEYHRELGALAARSGVRRLIARGEFAGETVRGAQESGLTNASREENDSAILRRFAEDLPSDGGVVLIKGSRGAALEGIAREIIERFGPVIRAHTSSL